jgi:signal transduction histidine kinase
MPQLPRLFATCLFVVLAALAALLIAPAWQSARGEVAVRAQPSAAIAPVARAASLAPRVALGLALVGCGLAVALVISLPRWSATANPSRSPFAASRSELGALSKLAESSVAQGEELNRERDVRRRAEEDVQLKQRLLTQALEEKIRLGQDLHDGIIQSLYALGLTLESVRGLLPENPAAADQRLEQCRNSLNAAIRDARAYLTGLAPENLRHASFGRALHALLDELRAGRDARFEIRIDDDAAALLTPAQTLEALQISREAVSNALRHGRATLVTVRVHKGDHEVCLLVQDNGAGFDAAHRRDGGHGLGNMQARAAAVGATLHITSRPGEGARVLANLPILHPASA